MLENCAAGDLFSVINDTGAVQEEGWMVTQVLLPLLQTLVYLHHEGLIHRDIKPENLLFNTEKASMLSHASRQPGGARLGRGASTRGSHVCEEGRSDGAPD